MTDAKALEEMRQKEFRARGKIASFCEGASRLIHAIDELPADAPQERCMTMLREMSKKLRGAVMRATD